MSDVHARPVLIEGRTSTGVWGAATGAGLLGILVAYFCYAHLYLAVSNEPWPPRGTPDLPLLAPALLVGWMALVAAAAVAAGRPLARGRDQLRRAVALGGVTLAGAAGIAAGIALVSSLELVGTAHAHDASALTLHAVVGVAAGAGVLITALTSYEAARVGDHAWVAAAVVVSAIWWVVVAVAWAAVAAVVYGWPQLT